MLLLLRISLLLLTLFLYACRTKSTTEQISNEPTNIREPLPKSKVVSNMSADAMRDSIVNFANQYIGTPYVYACSDPKKGFDCSGFVSFVFNHFGYEVPRSSIDFEHFGITVPIEKIQKGDLLLFTETDTTSTKIGHIGIVTKPAGMNSEFIHSSSGKAYGVTITPLNTKHYAKRFVKAVRVVE